MGSVLIVGGTGILAPAAVALTAVGEQVTILSRGGRAALPETEAISVDSRNATSLAAALGDRTWDRGLVYSPATTRASYEELRAHVTERCVLVRTSAAVDPVRGDPVIPPDTLQLGWIAPEPGHPSRWHTPGEVSLAAVALLTGGDADVLGAIRPWSDHPG